MFKIFITNFLSFTSFLGFWVFYRDLYDFIKEADGRVVSSFVKCNKPKKEIYLKLLDEYKLKASECVFIDDLEINIKGANDVGINGIVYKNLDDTLEKLNKFICKEAG